MSVLILKVYKPPGLCLSIYILMAQLCFLISIDFEIVLAS
jgi:hypothetical protein